MQRRNAIKNKVQKKIRKNLKNKSIDLNSESDSESNDINTKEKNKMISPRRAKQNNNIKEEKKNNKLLNNKLKRDKRIEDDIDNNIRMEKLEEEENIYKPFNKKIKQEEEDDNIVIFPYEFTERLIDALSCFYCKGIYIRPYVINISGCGHIFCLGCITKMLENGESGICPKCKNHFTERNVKYSEVTDYYIKTFFPEIPKIVEENKARLKQFMEQEAMKYNENRKENEKEKLLRCELVPFKENVEHKSRLPEIKNTENKFMIKIITGHENVVNMIKGEVIKRLKMRGVLKENDIEIRMQGIEISSFDTFESLNNLSINLTESNIFYYSKVPK